MKLCCITLNVQEEKRAITSMRMATSRNYASHSAGLACRTPSIEPHKPTHRTTRPSLGGRARRETSNWQQRNKRIALTTIYGLGLFSSPLPLALASAFRLTPLPPGEAGMVPGSGVLSREILVPSSSLSRDASRDAEPSEQVACAICDMRHIDQLGF